MVNQRARSLAPALILLFVGAALPVFANEGGHVEHIDPLKLTFGVVNFLIFAGLLAFGIRKIGRPKMAARRETFLKNLEQTQAAVLEAERKLLEIRTQLARVNTEVEDMRTRLAREAEMEEKEMLERAKQNVTRLLENSRKIMEFEKEKALSAIRNDFVKSVMSDVVSDLKAELGPEKDDILISKLISREIVVPNSDSVAPEKAVSQPRKA